MPANVLTPFTCAAWARVGEGLPRRHRRLSRSPETSSAAWSARADDVAIGLNDLADAERLSGDFDAAERDYREALRIAKAIDDREGVATSQANLAQLALDREDWFGAEALAREALLLAEESAARS